MLVELEEWEIEKEKPSLYDIAFSATIKFKEVDTEGKFLSSGKFDVSEFIRNPDLNLADNETIYDLINEVAAGIAKKLIGKQNYKSSSDLKTGRRDGHLIAPNHTKYSSIP